MVSPGRLSLEIFMLPDMSGLQYLEKVNLCGKFHFSKDLDDGAPYPSCVRKLDIWVRNHARN